MIDFRKIGLGSAASIVIFLLIALFVIIYLVLARTTLRQGLDE
jgi:ABC-type sugar transport system permease subunit